MSVELRKQTDIDPRKVIEVGAEDIRIAISRMWALYDDYQKGLVGPQEYETRRRVLLKQI